MRTVMVVLALILAACGGISVQVPSEIEDFDFDKVMGELRDCDRLSDTFVAVVRQMASDLDDLYEISGGRIPADELTEQVDTVVESGYFEVAKRLGCNAVAQRLALIDRLRGVDTGSPAGEDFLEEVIRQMEGQSSGSGSPAANASSTAVAAGSSRTT